MIYLIFPSPFPPHYGGTVGPTRNWALTHQVSHKPRIPRWLFQALSAFVRFCTGTARPVHLTVGSGVQEAGHTTSSRGIPSQLPILTSNPLPPARPRQQKRLTFKLHARHQVLVSRDGVDALPLAKIPHFAGVVATACGDVIPAVERAEVGRMPKLKPVAGASDHKPLPVWGKVDPVDLLEVTL